MTLRGTVKNGVVVLQNGTSLPDGTNVSVRAVKNRVTKPRPKSPGRRKLLQHAGKTAGLPADAAANLDHYLYGHAKR